MHRIGKVAVSCAQLRVEGYLAPILLRSDPCIHGCMHVRAVVFNVGMG